MYYNRHFNQNELKVIELNLKLLWAIAFNFHGAFHDETEQDLSVDFNPLTAVHP